MLSATLVPSPLPEDEQLVSCKVCLESVPLSESKSSEAEEYVAFFCGLECYDLWVHQSPKKNDNSKSNV